MLPKEKKNSLVKKIGKRAVKSTSDSIKGAALGSVTALGKNKIKEALKENQLKEKVDSKLKEEEKKIKKKLVKEGIKQAFKS